MKLLLDTRVFIWWREENARLKAPARRAIASAEDVFVSSASAWEAAIKIALGKLRLPEPFEAGVEASQFAKLPITFRHAAAVTTLPDHHADPFDRMLIVQAQLESLVVVTHDAVFKAYGVGTILT